MRKGLKSRKQREGRGTGTLPQKPRIGRDGRGRKKE